MRRLWMLSTLVLLALLPALLAAAGMARAQSYGPDLTDETYALDCGHNSTFVDDYAFDDNSTTVWISSQSGASVAGFACIGQAFTPSVYEIRRFGLRQNGGTSSVTSVILQAADDPCTSWYSVETVTVSNDNVMHYYEVAASQGFQCWRLLANSATGGSFWQNIEIEMMELVSWPTDTPGPTGTPTITLTPSTTPSPTPNYFVELTATSGAPMRFERGATAGDLFIFVALLILGGLGFTAFAMWFWQRRSDGS